MEPERLFSIATGILDGVIDHYASEVAALDDADEAAAVELPAQRFIANGAVAHDCPFVAVEVERIYTGQSATETTTVQRCELLRAAQFAIHVIRCVPSIEGGIRPVVPKPASIELSAEVVLGDAIRVQNAVVAMVAAKGEGPFGDNPEVSIREWLPFGPQGGLGGGTLRITNGLRRRGGVAS